MHLGIGRARRVSSVVALVAAWVGVSSPGAVHANPSGTGLVISQVYGGGGNSGAPYTNDFVELFNPTSASIDLTGMSLQYASATGTGNFAPTSLNGSVAPGQYYLVQEAAGATPSASLPTPDATGTIAMSATAGKVALANSTTSLGCNGGSTPCSPAQLALIVDLVGYGGANFFESSPTAVLSNTTAALRAGGGCIDTDSNAADFAVVAPLPRNTGTATNPCVPTGPSLSIADLAQDEGNGGTTTFTFTVTLSAPAGVGGVTFDVATSDGTATAPSDYGSTALTGQTIAEGATSTTVDVTVNGDTDVEPDESFTISVSNVSRAAVSDGQAIGTIVNDDVATCGSPATPISSIQGSAAAAAITGPISTEGVVVGDFQGSTGLQGFYLQDPVGDGDPATSDGIFVFTGGDDTVSVGEALRVTGFARERFNQTAINGANDNNSAVPAANILHCGPGAAVAPVDVQLPFPDGVYPERYEGMLVRFPQSLVISEYFNYERFGELVLAQPLHDESRPFTPTAVDAPGASALARAAANQLSRITLDDGLSIQNPEVLRHPDGQPFSLTNLFRGGDRVSNTIGVLGFDFSLYRIQPTAAARYTSANPRPATPEDVGGTIRAAAMNALNFFITEDATASDTVGDCGPSKTLDCRGADADQPMEFTRQRTKLLEALAGLDADVLGLNELENTPGADPLLDADRGIISGLNAKLGANTYAAIDTGVIGTDAIRVGLIYKPAGVTPVGAFELLDSSVDPRFIDTRNRPSLAQTFEVNATGARFTVVVNHLKSKGSACGVDDPDVGDGQGNCNVTRTNAAKALVDWIATDPTGSGDPDFLVLGDLNSYAMEDPITAVRSGADDTLGTGDDYTNLISAYQGRFAYSYVFDGQAGYLDQALASSTMRAQVDDAADWHINADEPDVLDYDTTFKGPAQEALWEPNQYRTSDHDAVLVGLTANAAPSVAAGPFTVAEGGSVTLAATASDPNGDALSYAWDLDGDGTFETAGATPVFSAAAIDGPAERTVEVRITDGGGLTATAKATVTVANVTPLATIAGPAAVTAGTSGTWHVSATDPAPADQAAGFSFSIDWGDGSPLEQVSATEADLSHTYADAGTSTISVTASDDDGGTGAAATLAVAVALASPSALLQPDPCAAGGQALVVTGTAGSDLITLADNRGAIQVLLGTTSLGSFRPSGQVIVSALGGNDLVVVDQRITRQQLLYGGAGNDAIVSGGGSAVIAGADGNDLAFGGAARDILIGGIGRDVLAGGNGDDVMIATATALDAPTPSAQASLCAALTSWNRTNVAYPERVAALQGAFGTLTDDVVTDVVLGGGGNDWFIINAVGGPLDVSDRAGAEIRTEL